MRTDSSTPPGQRGLFLVSAAAGLLFGYSIAVGNDAIGPIRQHFSLSSMAEGVVVSSLIVGALAGCLIAGRAAERYGHRRALMVAGFVAVAGTALAVAAPSVPILVVGRLMVGAAVGVTSAVTPVYVAETCHVRVRGAMIVGYQLAIAVGVLLALTVGAIFAVNHGLWRLMLAANAIPAIAQIAAVWIAPSSPVSAHAGTVDAASGARLELTKPVVIAMAAALMNALVGVGAVVYYSTGVFAIAGVGGRSGAEIASWSVGLVNVLATIVAVGLINRYGRRPLLTVGLSGIVAALVSAGYALLAPASGLTGVITVAAILVFMACYAFSAGPIAWLLVAEVLPARIRARAGATAAGLNWSANLLVALLFPVLVGAPGQPARVGMGFLFFAVLSGGFLVFVRRCVPETKGLTLAQLETRLAGGWAQERRLAPV